MRSLHFATKWSVANILKWSYVSTKLASHESISSFFSFSASKSAKKDAVSCRGSSDAELPSGKSFSTTAADLTRLNTFSFWIYLCTCQQFWLEWPSCPQLQYFWAWLFLFGMRWLFLLLWFLVWYLNLCDGPNQGGGGVSKKKASISFVISLLQFLHESLPNLHFDSSPARPSLV